MSFSSWLIDQKARGDAVGVLARAWEADTERGKVRSPVGVERYLREASGWDDGRYRALMVAISEFRDSDDPAASVRTGQWEEAADMGRKIRRVDAGDGAGMVAESTTALNEALAQSGIAPDGGPVELWREGSGEAAAAGKDLGSVKDLGNTAPDTLTHKNLNVHQSFQDGANAPAKGWKVGEQIVVNWLRPVLTETGWRDDLDELNGELVRHQIESVTVLVGPLLFVIPWHRVMFATARATKPSAAKILRKTAESNVIEHAPKALALISDQVADAGETFADLYAMADMNAKEPDIIGDVGIFG
jgi:hypothetical protein